MRLVSVLWGSNWYYYLTNVLDPQILSAQQVCELYRRRWRVEDAFLLTKRLLGLAYIWVGDTNGVQIQIFATWIFYAVLNQLCIDVAIALNQPLDRISTEMVFRALYHFSQAVLRGDASDTLREGKAVFTVIVNPQVLEKVFGEFVKRNNPVIVLV